MSFQNAETKPLDRQGPPPAHRPLNACRMLAATLALAVGLGASAGAAAPLQWKFKEGETIRYSLLQETKTTLKAQGREGGSTVNQRSDIRWVVKSVSPEGVAEMTQIIDRVRVKMDAAGQPPFEFDSEAKDQPQEGPLATQLAVVFKALAGFECSLTMDARGRIDNVKIPEKTVASLRESLKGAGGEVFSEEAMKGMIAQSSLVLPGTEAEVEQGKSWTEQSKVPVPMLGTIVTDKTYTVEGPDKDDPKLVRIVLDSKMSVEPGENANLKFELKNQKSVGHFLFDADKGRIAKSRVEVDMTQRITVGPQELEKTVNNLMEMNITPDEPAK